MASADSSAMFEEHEFRLALGQRRSHRLAVGKLLRVDAGAVQDQR